MWGESDPSSWPLAYGLPIATPTRTVKDLKHQSTEAQPTRLSCKPPTFTTPRKSSCHLSTHKVSQRAAGQEYPASRVSAASSVGGICVAGGSVNSSPTGAYFTLMTFPTNTIVVLP